MDPIVSEKKIKDERVYQRLYPEDFLDKQKRRLEEDSIKMIIGIVTRKQQDNYMSNILY